jgi:hypothetical protein
MSVSPATRPESAINFSDPVINHHPYPHFEEIRALGRAVSNPPTNAWLVTSFDDAKSIFSNVAEYAQDADMFDEIHV